jgi:hypothetical protein
MIEQHKGIAFRIVIVSWAPKRIIESLLKIDEHQGSH